MNNRFADAVSTAPKLVDALAAATGQLKEQLELSPDIVIAFVAGYSPKDFDAAMPQLQALTDCRNVMGCSCQAMISGGKEFEEQAGISLWAAVLPETQFATMRLEYERSPDGGAITGWAPEMEGDWPEDSNLIALGEPFNFPMDALLERLNEDRTGVNIVGGMASGAEVPGVSRLLLGEDVFTEGAIVARLNGGVKITPIVSQGCRPIGEPMVITAAERNLIQQLGGQPALLQLKKVFDTLPTSDQRKLQQGLHVGRVINEYQEKFAFGDFLIRNVVGFDDESGTIAIGDYVRPGQTVQFHIRDEDSASHELKQMLNAKGPAVNGSAETGSHRGALLFSCNGRGTHMFPDANHDASTVQDCLGEMPLAGFFAAGEIGPVGGKNFVHGFTASIMLFE